MRNVKTRCPARLRAAVLLTFAASLATLASSGSALAHDIKKAAAGETYEDVRGIGPAKAAGKGLLRVKLKNAETVLTHGLDRERPTADAAPPAALGAPTIGGPERPPVCSSEHHQHVLYGYPADRQSRLAAVKETLVDEIRRMNAVLNEESLASGGGTADYKVRCDSGGEIQVDAFRSAQTDSRTTFSGVVSAARAAGFDAQDADYTIFFDSAAPPACGTGTFSPDQRLAAENSNNSGGDYAVVYSNCWTDRTAMHENGHNQGAVQYDAPFSTGDGAHCNDDYDVMCYADGGDLDVGMSVFCQDKMRFDCRHDTYFDASPEPGEYLASNWNLGSSLNRFIAFGAPAPEAAACEDGLDNDGDGRTDFAADPGCTAATDTDELDPVPPVATNPVPPVAVPPAQAAPQTSAADVPPAPVVSLTAPPTLPTLSMSAARRYARGRIKRKHPRAKRIGARCTRRTRTSAACKVRWRIGSRAAYSGRMVVSYRLRGSQVSLAASSRVRRIR